MIQVEEIPNPPPRLFKYQGVTEYSLKNLENCEVFLAPRNVLNDPHELGFILESYPQYRIKEIELAKQRELFFKDSGYVDSIKEMLDTGREVTKHKEDTVYFSELINNSGVLSTTADPLNRLMWSHYANSHKGFCLEFESDFLNGKNIALYPADYLPDTPILSFSEQRDFQYRQIKQMNPSFSLVGIHKFYLENSKAFKQESTQQLLLAALTAKHEDWKYENEWRYVCGKNGAVNYQPKKLKSIILGMQITDEDKDNILKIVANLPNGNEVVIKQIVKRPNSFEIELKVLEVAI
jgi:hypothetical protein